MALPKTACPARINQNPQSPVARRAEGAAAHAESLGRKIPEIHNLAARCHAREWHEVRICSNEHYCLRQEFYTALRLRYSGFVSIARLNRVIQSRGTAKNPTTCGQSHRSFCVIKAPTVGPSLRSR